ncbi:transposase [Bradyrhizobium sp. ORS 86]|uniref:IS66 family transposase n=1 Tax=Bradyrhizobium sp. ORS 86 TaxID=1685970 RepID=UPI00388E6471
MWQAIRKRTTFMMDGDTTYSGNEYWIPHVIDSKYHWHLLSYRQAQRLATHSIAIDRSTLRLLIGYAAQELMPLWHRGAVHDLRPLRAIVASSIAMAMRPIRP